jgi:hypothetical protein
MDVSRKISGSAGEVAGWIGRTPEYQKIVHAVMDVAHCADPGSVSGARPRR